MDKNDPFHDFGDRMRAFLASYQGPWYRRMWEHLTYLGRRFARLSSAFAEEQRALIQLCDVQKACGVGIATAIALLRAIPKSRGDARIGQAKRTLQEALTILVPNDDQRYAMLERARQKVEEEEQPSAASGGPPSA